MRPKLLAPIRVPTETEKMDEGQSQMLSEASTGTQLVMVLLNTLKF